MKDRSFLDTNILVYSFLPSEGSKHNTCKNLLNSLISTEVCISTQVLNELYVALKKNGISDVDARYYVEYCISKYNVFPIGLNEVQACLELRDRYAFSYWDSLILAAAIENDCAVIYSEDMKSDQIINSNFKIINPLLSGE